MTRTTHAIVRALLSVMALAVAAVVLYAYHLSDPRIVLPSAARERFANVVVLLDGTRSMSDINFNAAKHLVAETVIRSHGIGDRLVVYGLGPDFSLHNVISGGTYAEQPPQLDAAARTGALVVVRQARSGHVPGRVRAKLRGLIQQVQEKSPDVEHVRATWTSQVQAMKRPVGTGSNLTCAVESIGRYFQASHQADEERWLFIVSDLIQDARSSRTCRLPDDSDLFAGVRIVLVYPHDSAHNWEQILHSWRQHFGDRVTDVRPFSAALNQEYLLPPNPLAGLERIVVRGFWTNLVAIVTGRWLKPSLPQDANRVQ
jgi:hypothetical protein